MVGTHTLFLHIANCWSLPFSRFWVWSDRLTVHLAPCPACYAACCLLPACLADCRCRDAASMLSALYKYYVVRRWTATRPSRLLLVVTLAQSCCSGPFCYCSPQLPSIFQLPLTTCRRIRLRSKLTGLWRRRVGSACAQ